ncbi:hypothetical protein GYMLUDRAFT_64145 [Collybiopsis luxurians FD-317 M1]|uniref:Uncharacterized protein n=1 Tax=Collybiopsis luxurians FD-317 M1 TaxID=944289 RepID=A0A0D0BSM6_9AGAR|nr:hypothetical protein GYMLUDRAFT_64145 [Collybiopsis luxurians FD-317 M1]
MSSSHEDAFMTEIVDEGATLSGGSSGYRTADAGFNLDSLLLPLQPSHQPTPGPSHPPIALQPPHPPAPQPPHPPTSIQLYTPSQHSHPPTPSQSSHPHTPPSLQAPLGDDTMPRAALFQPPQAGIPVPDMLNLEQAGTKRCRTDNQTENNNQENLLKDLVHQTDSHFEMQSKQMTVIMGQIEQNNFVLNYLWEVLDFTNQRVLHIECKDKGKGKVQSQTETECGHGEGSGGGSGIGGGGDGGGSGGGGDRSGGSSRDGGDGDDIDPDADNKSDIPMSSPSKTTPKKSGTKKHVPKEELQHRETICNWLNMLIGEHEDPLENKVSASEADQFVKEFTKDLLKRPCTIEDFQYFLEGGPRSAWNLGALYIFVDFVGQKNLHDISDAKTREGICKAFLAQIKTLCGEYLKLAKLPERQEIRKKYHRKWQRKYSVSSTILASHCDLIILSISYSINAGM